MKKYLPLLGLFFIVPSGSDAQSVYSFASRKDGMTYRISNQTGNGSARLMRADSGYVFTDLGVIPVPLMILGETDIIDPASGDMDADGNFYFLAVTINETLQPTPSRIYIGKIAQPSTLQVTAPPKVDYYELEMKGMNCKAFVSAWMGDPVHSGIRNIMFNERTNSFFTYVTYKLPGVAAYAGQLMQLIPVEGSTPQRYQLWGDPIVNMHTTPVVATTIDHDGNFAVLFHNGSVGVINRTNSGGFGGKMHIELR